MSGVGHPKVGFTHLALRQYVDGRYGAFLSRYAPSTVVEGSSRTDPEDGGLGSSSESALCVLGLHQRSLRRRDC